MSHRFTYDVFSDEAAEEFFSVMRRASVGDGQIAAMRETRAAFLADPTICVVADPNGDGYSFSTPDGDYGAHSLEEALSLARSLGYDDVEVER